MNRIECTGVTDSNPLHFLAALGLLVISDKLSNGQATLSWRTVSSSAYPIVQTSLSSEAWLAHLVSFVRTAAEVRTTKGKDSAERALKAEAQTLAEAVKKLRTKAQSDAKERGLKGSERSEFIRKETSAMESELQRVQSSLEQIASATADALGDGIAHLGDIIGVPVAVFESKARKAWAAKDFFVLQQLAALASDGCVDDKKGTVLPSPLSFSNGASGQCLLKDWRNLASALDAADLANFLFHGAAATKDVTSLNWDPADLRSAALRWRDPSSAPGETNVAANVFAYLGLAALTVVPTQQELRLPTLRGEQPHGHSFVWPIWESPLSLRSVRSLLATNLPEDASGRQRWGVSRVWRSARVNPDGKRFYFAPAVPT